MEIVKFSFFNTSYKEKKDGDPTDEKDLKHGSKYTAGVPALGRLDEASLVYKTSYRTGIQNENQPQKNKNKKPERVSQEGSAQSSGRGTLNKLLNCNTGPYLDLN